MDRNTYLQLKKMFLVGLIASVVTVLGGELPIGWVVYPEVEGDPFGILGMLLGSADLSLPQLASGILFGGIGIPLQYYGFEAIARITEKGGSKKSAKLIHWGALATGFLGGIVHILCVALMFVCRLSLMPGVTTISQPILDFTLWLVMPISVVFMPVYYAMCIAMLVVIIRGNTTFPKWAAVFNPLTATIVLNALPMIAPGSAIINALGMANMGLGSVLTFGGLLFLFARHYSKSDGKDHICSGRQMWSFPCERATKSSVSMVRTTKSSVDYHSRSRRRSFQKKVASVSGKCSWHSL